MFSHSKGSDTPSIPPATTGDQNEVLPFEVKANQKSEIGNPQTVTKEMRKRASGRAFPRLFRSWLYSHVWMGAKKTNMTPTPTTKLRKVRSAPM